jgi:5,10-methylenetetrahydromethanopterin reductase
MASEKIGFDIGFMPVENIRIYTEYAKLAERLGVFENAWIAELHNFRDAITCCASMALGTQQLGLGVVLSEYLRDPCIMASTFATLDELSNGRFIIGLVPGDKTQTRTIGVGTNKPIGFTREYVTLIRRLLSGEEITYESEFFQWNQAQIDVTPQKPIPVWIGARGPQMLALAGKIGDGCLIDASHPLEIQTSAELVRKAAKKAKNPIQVGAFVTVSTSKRNPDAAKRRAGHMAAFIGTTQPDFVYERLDVDIERDVDPIRHLLRQKQFKKAFELAYQNKKILDNFTASGSPAEVRDRLSEIINATKVERVIFGEPSGPDVNEALNLMATEIIPRL